MQSQTNEHIFGRSRKLLIAVVWLILISALGVTAFSGYRLWQANQVYLLGDQSYGQLQLQMRRPIGPQAASSVPTLVDIPSNDINFRGLQQINKDSVAWLYGPDTPIDYPVMRADDYDYYLHHLPDGTWNDNGTLFLDFNGPEDFSSSLSIIYGHNMKTDKMFGSLTSYKKQEYFELNPYLYLYTPDGNYRIDLLYGSVIAAGEWRERAFIYGINREALLNYAATYTTFESGVTYTARDRIIVLSTCSYEFDDARYVVLGVLRPEYSSLDQSDMMQLLDEPQTSDPVL